MQSDCMPFDFAFVVLMHSKLDLDVINNHWDLMNYWVGEKSVGLKMRVCISLINGTV